MVIDSGPTYAYAQQAYTVMQKKEKLPVKYVINTSAEELNILGNKFYKEQGATLIGPKSYEKLIKEKKPLILLEKLSNAIFINTNLVPLDVYQNENSIISMGEINIEIKKLEKNDSTKLVVYLPSEETIFVGNYVSNKQIEAFINHKPSSEWISNIKNIEKLSWKNIITAHGSTTTRKRMTVKLSKIITPKPKIHDETAAILAAMGNIKTSKVLKEGTTKGILINKKSTIIASKIEKKKSSNKEKIKKSSIKNRKKSITIEKVEITQETSVQSIIEEASKTTIAPTTEEIVPCINYDKNAVTARQHAIAEHKMLLVKIEADNCAPCEKLDRFLKSNKRVRKMINKYTTAIKVNSSYEAIPLGINSMGTPTIVVLDPETKNELMRLQGTAAYEDLEDSLRTITGEDDIKTLAFAK